MHALTYWDFLTPTVVAPVVNIDSTTATTIQLSWTSSGLVVDSYEVKWERTSIKACSEGDMGIDITSDGSTSTSDSSSTDGFIYTDVLTSYIISGIEEDSSYSITVTATNAAGNAVSVPVTGMTMEAGEIHTK